MKRREFITLVGGAVTWPVIASQQSAKIKRIALVVSSVKVGDMTVGGASGYPTFFEELGHLGYVKRRNL
jgi:hypothetical protein